MRRFLATLALLAAFCLPVYAERATEGGPKYSDGTEVQCDLPLSHWIKNVGGRDGAGLCVFTSINMAAHWQNCEELSNFQKQMRSEPGGGYPEKVDRMMKKYAPTAKYVQYSGNDPAVLDLSIKTGRMPSVTYGYSERYGGRVAHMVNLVHIDDKLACVLDNNFIGAERLEWMSRGEFLRRWKLGGGGWAVILLNPPPPPIPVNVAPAPQMVYGSWEPSGCGPVGSGDSFLSFRRSKLSPAVEQKVQNAPVDARVISPDAHWRVRQDDPGRFYLYRGSIQVGGWDGNIKRWMDYDVGRGAWEDGYPPWFVHQTFGNGNKSVGQNFFGVDRKQVPQQETFSVNGHRVEFRNAKEAFGDDALSDDSGKLRITLCGTKEMCDRVVSDMKSHPAMAQMSSKFLVQCYRPGTWPTEVFKRPAGEGFFLSIEGPPDKKSRGLEYHTQVAYESPDKLAEAMGEALRRADPNYDPNKTPDLTKPKPPPAPPPGLGGEGSAWLLVIVVILAYLFGGKRDANS